MTPFFSIVTEVFNRKLTIERTISSIFNQSFADFEYIIVDAGSTDGSKDIVSKLVSKSKDKRISFHNYPFESNEIARWNLPLEHCTGKYIVVLEGDDWFDCDYLLQAYKVLKVGNIGIYVGKRNGIETRWSGLIANQNATKIFQLLEFCPAPSEAIFIRTNNLKKFKYDSVNFIWAAEYSLYNDILISGYDIFIENSDVTSYVHRGVSNRLHSSHHLQDLFLIASKNSIFLNPNEVLLVEKKIAHNVGRVFASQILQRRFELKLFLIFLLQIKKGAGGFVVTSFFVHMFKGFARIIKILKSSFIN
jgi:glycosyltransferase involved in cell wall biosynthesis